MSVHTIRTAIHTVITASYDVTILAAIRNGSDMINTQIAAIRIGVGRKPM